MVGVGNASAPTYSADSLRFFRALPAVGAPAVELAPTGVMLVTISCWERAGGGVVWCGVVWCGVVWCGVVWRRSTAQRGTGGSGGRERRPTIPPRKEKEQIVAPLMFFCRSFFAAEKKRKKEDEDQPFVCRGRPALHALNPHTWIG